ncbi:MAG: sulfatase activating formylglycine-generating enzyme, partial [Myxococcota bacterium]
DWHDEHHQFVGYPVETAPIADIKITAARAHAEYPVDDMVTIPAGEFTFGSPAMKSSSPAQKVNLGAYRMDRYEVTNSQYQKFIKDTGHKQPELRDEWAKDYSWREQTFPKGMANRPVTLVSLEDARAYCRWAGKRLPSEQEWEKAARGTEGNTWPWGNTWDGRKAHTVERFSGPLKDQAEWKRFEENFDEDAEIHAWPVGSYGGDKSPYGVMDMHGNVSEWVDSGFDAYDGGDNSGHPLLGKKDTIVVRGNSFANRDYAAPSSVRYPFAATYVEDTIGFRCAAEL